MIGGNAEEMIGGIAEVQIKVESSFDSGECDQVRYYVVDLQVIIS